MEQSAVVFIRLPEALKRWLELQAASRIVEGRPHGERSVNAVVVDLIEAAKRKNEKAVAA